MEHLSAQYLEINRNLNRGYRKLVVWREAIDLYSVVKLKLKTIPAIPFKVRAQVEDSIFSVSSNIAEGHCRRSLKENIQFISIALASLGENYSQIFALFNSKDIDEDWFKEYDKMHYCLENKMIQFICSMIRKLKEKGPWSDDYIKEIGESLLSK